MVKKQKTALSVSTKTEAAGKEDERKFSHTNHSFENLRSKSAFKTASGHRLFFVSLEKSFMSYTPAARSVDI
jgi:hypothetical protein